MTTTYGYDRTGVLRSRVDGGTTTYFAYDGYGNLTSDASAVNQVTTLTYDLADRLTSIVLPGGGNTTTSFTFDALGRVATRTPPGGAAETLAYLGTSGTAWSVSGTPAVSSALDPAGTRLASSAGGVTGFVLADLHANLAAVVNAGETALLSATRSDPYGLTSATYDSGGPSRPDGASRAGSTWGPTRPTPCSTSGRGPTCRRSARSASVPRHVSWTLAA